MDTKATGSHMVFDGLLSGWNEIWLWFRIESDNGSDHFKIPLGQGRVEFTAGTWRFSRRRR